MAGMLLAGLAGGLGGYGKGLADTSQDQLKTNIENDRLAAQQAFQENLARLNSSLRDTENQAQSARSLANQTALNTQQGEISAASTSQKNNFDQNAKLDTWNRAMSGTVGPDGRELTNLDLEMLTNGGQDPLPAGYVSKTAADAKTKSDIEIATKRAESGMITAKDQALIDYYKALAQKATQPESDESDTPDPGDLSEQDKAAVKAWQKIYDKDPDTAPSLSEVKARMFPGSAGTISPVPAPKQIAPAGTQARVKGKIVTSDGKGGWN